MASIAQRATDRPAFGIRADWLAAIVLALATFATRAIWFGDPVAEFDEQHAGAV